MQNIFLDTRILDEAAQTRYALTEDIMMENAANALRKAVLEHLHKCEDLGKSRPTVLVLAGTGNNGADGYALSRQLISHGINAAVCKTGDPKSQMCALQSERAAKIGVRIFDAQELDAYLEEDANIKCVVDCIYGSGFHGKLPPVAEAVVLAANALTEAQKIACDVPTGLDRWGCGSPAFQADRTVAMGAYKLALFSDRAKDACGRISVGFLGISRDNFERGNAGEPAPDAYLLEEKDMKLPYRTRQNVNKGCFGHVAVASGEKRGASIMAANAAMRFGAGLVTLVGASEEAPASLPPELMYSGKPPANTSALAVGMGLGRRHEDSLLCFGFLMQNKDIPAVLDADVFYNKDIVRLIKQRPKGLVLTPHPKEFLSLLELCGLNIIGEREIRTVSDCAEHRFEAASAFCKAFPDTVLLLKGANTIIATCGEGEPKEETYINTLGTNALAKAGSGDVLSGVISALLAQGYEPKEAAITASLAHAKAARLVCESKNGFSLTASDLLEALALLE